MKTIGVVVAVILGLVVVGLGIAWLSAGANVVSPDNVKAQYAQAYQNYESLQATAGNVCAQRKAVAGATDPDTKVQLQSQELAYEQNYRNVAASYNAAYDNAFAAKHVGPGDLPNKAPGLDQALAAAGCTATG